MGRPLGSKNKPKVVQQTPTPTIKEEQVPEIKEPRKPRKKKEQPDVVPSTQPALDQDAGPSYLAINMNNFVFTEHLLTRYAKYIMSHMDDHLRLVRTAAAVGETDTEFLIKKMLKAAGLSQQKIDKLIDEVKNYQNTNKPEQLYVRIKKR